MSVTHVCVFYRPYLVVHRSLFTGDRPGAARRHSSVGRVQQQQQIVARQRLQQAEQGGFKPIDKPCAINKASATSFTGNKLRHQSTGGVSGARRSSESSNNPLSGDEYY
jgi:hypothetical protein